MIYQKRNIFNNKNIEENTLFYIPILKTINNKVLCINKDSVIDLSSKNFDNSSKNTVERIYDLGTSNSIGVGRILLQSKLIIDELIFINEQEKYNIEKEIWEISNFYISAEYQFYKIEMEIKKYFLLNKDILILYKDKNPIPPLNKIHDLEEKVFLFFRNIKFFLIKIFRLINIFYDFNLGKEGDFDESKFDNHIKKINDVLNSNHPLSILLQKIEFDIRFLSELRNSFEHKKEKQRSEVLNFKYSNDKIKTPSIIFDVRKRLSEDMISKSNYELTNFLGYILDTSFYIYENIFFTIIDDIIKDKKIFHLKNIKNKDLFLPQFKIITKL